MKSIRIAVPALLSERKKRYHLAKIALKRKQNTPHDAYSVRDFYFGAYESEWVSPYTKSAANLNADVMVLLQDWASKEYLSKKFRPELALLGLDPKLPTSQRLDRLLTHHLNLRLCDTFATNLNPFIKQGSLSAAMTWQNLLFCAEQYALPQIEIISPRLVICLGLNVFNALSIAAGGVRHKRLDNAIKAPFLLLSQNGNFCYVFAQSHTGFHGYTSRNRNNRQQVELDWNQMMSHFKYEFSPY
ncbi:hypothetical protein [Vibrio sp. 10N.222.52.B12]|uniref:hypothetical protein n=1 Tax=Vibrio TaxID=662 RepID=UPI000A741569|nr:hypothetical protein [Vibrio sp. 10N.222.52.B12]PMO40184.1 hypothetical protein BCT11_13590 [Vibrio sp. 10N.222.52.B12]HDZ3729220.1 hypothetical protein [Vibrio harveyi]HDZ3734102.1 hypothetical protein [Vibrio harveyi]